MQTEFLCVSVLRVASGPRVKLVSCKSALNLPVVLVVPKHMNGFLLTRDLLSIPILSILLLSLQ